MAKYDIEIKHFLGIPIVDISFDYSTISVFRKRLGAEKFEAIFQQLLNQIKQKGLLDDYKTQIIDDFYKLVHSFTLLLINIKGLHYIP